MRNEAARRLWMRRGERASRRVEDTVRFLSRVRVRVPAGVRRKRAGAPTSLAVPLNIARAVASQHAETVSPQLLRWAAQQATLLSPRKRKGQRTSARVLFLLDLSSIFDYASNALKLRGTYPRLSATRIELTRQTAREAEANARAYHEILARINKGAIVLRPEEHPFMVGAMIGVSPGALRARNGPRNLERLISEGRGGSVRLAEPKPLVHRHELMRLPKGRAWIWVHPDDKSLLGAGYGWCVSDSQRWRNALQFAVVDDGNRPHALLTIPLGSKGPIDVGGDHNKYVGTSRGRAWIDYAKMKKDLVRPFYGQLKGRYNERPPPSPYREDVVRLMKRPPFGALRVRPGETAPSDWTATLTVPGDLAASKRNWKAAGGASAIFSVADSLPITTRGEGGPTERTLNYFGDRPGQWLRSPLAPLVMAAMGPELAREVVPNLPPKLLAERARIAARTTGALVSAGRVEGPERAALQDAIMARRRGARLPPSLVRDWRERMRNIREVAKGISPAAARRLVQGRTEMAGGDRKLAAMWALYLSNRPEPILTHNVMEAIGNSLEDQFAVTLLCELIHYGLLMGLTSSNRTNRVRGKIIDQAGDMASAVGRRGATWENLEEALGSDDIEREPGDPVFDWGGQEIAQGDHYPLAWLRAGQSDGSGSFHCFACAGFQEEPTNRREGGLAGRDDALTAGTMISCVDYVRLFDIDVMESWYPFGDQSDLAGILLQMALHPYPVEDLIERSGEYADVDQMYEDLMEGEPISEQVFPHILLTLAMFKVSPEFVEHYGDNAGLVMEEEAVKLKAKITPRHQRLLNKAEARIRSSTAGDRRRIPPLELMVMLEKYQVEWEKVNAEALA